MNPFFLLNLITSLLEQNKTLDPYSTMCSMLQEPEVFDGVNNEQLLYSDLDETDCWLTHNEIKSMMNFINDCMSNLTGWMSPQSNLLDFMEENIKPAVFDSICYHMKDQIPVEILYKSCFDPNAQTLQTTQILHDLLTGNRQEEAEDDDDKNSPSESSIVITILPPVVEDAKQKLDCHAAICSSMIERHRRHNEKIHAARAAKHHHHRSARW